MKRERTYTDFAQIPSNRNRFIEVRRHQLHKKVTAIQLLLCVAVVAFYFPHVFRVVTQGVQVLCRAGQHMLRPSFLPIIACISSGRLAKILQNFHQIFTTTAISLSGFWNHVPPHSVTSVLFVETICRACRGDESTTSLL